MNKTTRNRVWTVAHASDLGLSVRSAASGRGRRGTALRYQWLIENVPRGTILEVPDRSSHRPVPFIDERPE